LAVIRDTPRAGLAPVPGKLPKDGGSKKQTVYTTRSATGIVAPESGTLGSGRLRAGQATTLPGRFLFDFDSATLTPKGVQIVKALVKNLQGTQAAHCEGYTDYAGNHAHEMKLSQQRARVVCSALKAYGAKVTTTTRGYAGARPVIIGGKARDRHENRRVVVVVKK
jgi:outer membrane protein OmpA-like peptidoglycan-associated protein